MKERKVYCPFCGSKKSMWKRGFVYDAYGKHQRYECKNCHRVTYRPLLRKR